MGRRKKDKPIELKHCDFTICPYNILDKRCIWWHKIKKCFYEKDEVK